MSKKLRDISKANLLVTGGAGFMGSCFIRHILKEANFAGKVFNLDALTYSGNLQNLQSVEKDQRYFFIKANILHQELIEEILEKEKIDIIVHFAAETHVDKSIDSAKVFLQTNVLGTASLLEAVRKFPKIHFHHISTDEVYGSLPEVGLFSEESPYLPNSPYAASKASSDHLVRSYAKTYHLSTTISHAGNNYGPYQYPEKFIPLMILRMLEKKPLPVYGNGLNVRDWLYVEDHAKAISLILENGRPSEVYNVASGDEISNLNLLKKIMQIVSQIANLPYNELEALITFTKDRPGHDFRYAMDTKKAKEELSFVSSFSLEEGLVSTVQWYLGNQSWLKSLQNESFSSWMDKQYR